MIQIRQSLLDVKRHLRFFILIQLLSISTIGPFASGTLSLISSLNYTVDNRYLVNFYEYVPVKNDMSHNQELTKDLYEYICQKGSSYYLSSSLTNALGENTFVLIGDASLYVSQQIESNMLYVYNPNEYPYKKDLYINGEKYSVNTFNGNEIDIQDTDFFYFIQIEDVNIFEWLDYGISSEIINLIQNLRFHKSVKNEIEGLKTILDNSFLELVEIEQVEDGEKDFIVHYLYPIIILSLINIVIGFLSLHSEELKEIRKEYTIHLYYGATIQDIMKRNAFFLLWSWFMSQMIVFFLSNGAESTIFILCTAGLIVFYILMWLIMFHDIKREDLQMNLRR